METATQQRQERAAALGAAGSAPLAAEQASAAAAPDRLAYSASFCADLKRELRCSIGFASDTPLGAVTDWRATFGQNVSVCGKAGAGPTLAVRGVFAVLMASIWLWASLEHVQDPAAGASCAPAAYGCTLNYTKSHDCQCNDACAAHHNCCHDYLLTSCASVNASATAPDGISISRRVRPADGYGYGYFWIYLTYLTLTLQTLYQLLATAVAWSARSNRGDGDSTAIPLPAKATWLLQSVCLPASFFVFVMYWVLVCPFGDCRLKAVSFFTHGVNFAIMLTDAYLSGRPLLLPHAFYTFGYVLLYLAWTVIHYTADLANEKGDRYIYKQLDWSKPGSAAALSVGIFFVITPLIVLGCWTIMRCRTKRNGLAGVETHKLGPVP